MDSMDKKTLIAIVLALTVLIASQYIFTTYAPKTPRLPQEAEKKTEERKMPGPIVLPPSEIQQTAGVRDVKVETDLYIATLTSMGGTIRKFDLKRYRDKDGMSVSLLRAQGIYPPLGIGQDDFSLSKINFDIKGSDLRLEGSQAGAITFEYASSKFSIRRTYTFYADRYRVDLKDEVTGIPEYWITLGSDFGIHDPRDSSAPHIGPVILKDTDRIELTGKKLGEPKSYRDGLHWIAQEDKYFFASIVPAGQVMEAKAWKVQDSSVIALKTKSGINSFMIYAGPKDYDRLKELNVGLQHIIDFGFFSILARPLFWILKLFYKFMGNYGWAIVLLTIVVRIPFIPLLSKGQRSMNKLKELQPRLSEIREKYKKDPQRMQKEMMEMYRKYKVNPMGGCLPILLQIPVFFALYKVLMIAIELRGAPFMLWIKDLSAKDPYYILPIVMGVTMVIQQKMTPTSVDPKQNKIMMFMPVIFTFLFLNFASGLVLYWLVNNILSIAQQLYTNRKLAKQIQ
ncbi:MAG: membrane protein insertase YidC [Thermodesulfovibrionales bacterium]